jgi:hypothetical protein
MAHQKSKKKIDWIVLLLYNPTSYGRIVSMSNCPFALCWTFSFFFSFLQLIFATTGGSTTVLYQTWRVFNVVASSRWLFLRYRANMSSTRPLKIWPLVWSIESMLFTSNFQITHPRGSFCDNSKVLFPVPQTKENKKIHQKNDGETCIYIVYI